MKTKIRVLVVDDDRSTLEIYQESLTLAGLDVITATNGTDAYLLFKKHNPDVLFTGIDISGMDGFSLIEKIRSETGGNAPFCIINSHIDRDQDRKKAQDIGIDGYFVRGFSAPIKVVQHIKDLMSTRKREITYTQEQFEEAVEKAVREELLRQEALPTGMSSQSKRKIILFTAVVSVILTTLILASFWWLFLTVLTNNRIAKEEYLSENTNSSLEQKSETETFVQKEPFVGTLFGEVISVGSDSLVVRTDISGDGSPSDVTVFVGDTKKENMMKTIGTFDKKTNTFKELRTDQIGIQNIQKGDSVSFILTDEMYVSEVESGSAVLSAEQVFVGPPVNQIQE